MLFAKKAASVSIAFTLAFGAICQPARAEDTNCDELKAPSFEKLYTKMQLLELQTASIVLIVKEQKKLEAAVDADDTPQVKQTAEVARRLLSQGFAVSDFFEKTEVVWKKLEQKPFEVQACEDAVKDLEPIVEGYSSSKGQYDEKEYNDEVERAIEVQRGIVSKLGSYCKCAAATLR